MYRPIFIMEKEFTSYQQQIDILKSRNLQFSNEDYAKHCLETNNYYSVINGYKDKFLLSTKPERYMNDVDFNHIYALYEFDNALRTQTLIILLEIEKTLKSVILHDFAEKHGAFAYLDANSYSTSNSNCRDQVLNKFNEIIKNANHPKYINDKKYDTIRNCINKGRQIPIWVMFTMIDMGTLSKFYTALKSETKYSIASHLSNIYKNILTTKDLANCLRRITEVRNICAHNQRLIYYVPSVRMSGNNYFVHKYYGTNYKSNTLNNINCLFIALSHLTNKNTLEKYIFNILKNHKKLQEQYNNENLYLYLFGKIGLDFELILKIFANCNSFSKEK